MRTSRKFFICSGDAGLLFIRVSLGTFRVLIGAQGDYHQI